jgi:hypothetical protein
MARKPSRQTRIATRVPPAKLNKIEWDAARARRRLRHVKENCDGKGRTNDECGMMSDE